MGASSNARLHPALRANTLHGTRYLATHIATHIARAPSAPTLPLVEHLDVAAVAVPFSMPQGVVITGSVKHLRTASGRCRNARRGKNGSARRKQNRPSGNQRRAKWHPPGSAEILKPKTTQPRGHRLRRKGERARPPRAPHFSKRSRTCAARASDDFFASPKSMSVFSL